MTASLLEIARARFLAASAASVVIGLGPTTVRISREAVLLVRPGSAPQAPAATTPPWTDIQGVVALGGQATGASVVTHFLVGLENVVALEVVD